MNEAGRVDRMENASLLFTAGTHSSIIVHKVSSGKLVFTTYIPASIHNEAMLSGAWTSIAQ